MTQEERNAWLAERKLGIGGSEAAAVMGLSPWATPATIWLDKTGRAAPKEETEAMRIGTALEDFVARRYCRETGRMVQRYNKMVHVDVLLGNFDRLVVREGENVASHMGEVRTNLLLECKTSSREWDDGVPLYYQTQVQHYMGLVPCLEAADVACLFLGRKHFEIYRVDRDQAVIDHMQAYLRAWWEKHIVNDLMPAPTCEADCKLLWERSTPGAKITVTAEIREKLDAFRTAKKNEKTAKDEASKLQGEIETYMGDKEVLVDPAGKPLLTWKSAKDTVKTATDWQAIAEEINQGEIEQTLIDKHTTTTSTPGSRRFTPKTTDKAEKSA
jgi:putative phage-type endonuclease